MITFEVERLGADRAEIDPKDLRRFPGVRLRPPADFPWGREVHIVDPGGVRRHVREASRPGYARAHPAAAVAFLARAFPAIFFRRLAGAERVALHARDLGRAG